MTEHTYRIGYAAHRLKTTSHILRRLAKTGLIQADMTPRGQLLFPITEIERLEKEGLPALPVELPEEGDEEEEDVPFEPIDDFEEDDEFGEGRAAVEAERTALVDRQQVAQEEARRKAVAESAAQRKNWESAVLTRVMNLLPSDLPSNTKSEAVMAAREKLAELSPDDSGEVVSLLVLAAAESRLTGYRDRKRVEAAEQAAMDELPYGCYNRTHPTPDQIEAKRLVHLALREAPSGLSEVEMCSIARRAVQPILKRHKQEATKQAILRRLDFWMFGKATSGEREAATEDAEEVLKTASPQASEADLEKLVERALKPHERDVRERIEEQRKEQETEQLVAAGLAYLNSSVSRDYELDLETISQLREALPDAIREAVEDDGLDANGYRQFVREWVEDQLDYEE